MTEQLLEVKVREGHGKEASKKLRRQGLVPAVFYQKEKSRSLQVEELEFKKVLKSGKQVVELKFDGKKHKALIKDIQFHPVSEHILHIDFQGISMSEVVQVTVPLNFLGTPVGVKAGGLFDVNMHEIEVKCKASDIPAHLDVDVTGLEIGFTLHVSDLKFKDLEITSHHELLIASVTVAKDLSEKIEAPEEGEEGEEGEE
ncbi:MAG: 50S ribosomal protein L25, partial [Candidatus Marinimicrobia bacterium]|nr:50S ribosomal protein L25 [Candidatus Neomarinimicrobiota bacterium]